MTVVGRGAGGVGVIAAAAADDEDEESTAICPHCLNPPVPPLRDYAMWREKNLSN